MTSIKYTDRNGDVYFRDENHLYHRGDDLPAIELIDGYRAWFWHGERHRTAGPARIYHNRTDEKEWWVNGERIYCKTQEEFEKLMRMKAFW